MREPPKIAEERLRACLQKQYDLSPITLEFLPRGKDYYAGVYRVVSEEGSAYLLKVTSRRLYEPGCLVPAYLSEHGITSVVAPVPTKNHALWMKLLDWTVIVYPWISGDTSLMGMTNEQWKEVGSIFKRIHQAELPAGGFPGLREETFNPAEYARWIHNFEADPLRLRYSESGPAYQLHADWMAHQSTIHTALATLEKLAVSLKGRSLPYVICHADMHPANLIRDQYGRVFVIDWDEVMLAPKERDFIFVREPQADAFWQGYGQKEIDWAVLTYYRWERVVQDVIETANNVCFRDDLGDEAKTDIAQLFRVIVAEDNANIVAAYQASAHLAL
jgi:spectinomycin phosphotransferase